jgi:tripartite-type tricarboxylate transporter receptor subunit TctC
MQRLHLMLVMLLVASAGALGTANAQSYPTRPVRIIVPFGPGGPPDVIARLVAQKLSERWGHQVYVENIPGAGGNIGYLRTIDAPPDGYTLVSTSPGFTVNPSLYVKSPFDPLRDFSLITLVAGSPNVLAVHPSVPAKTLAELIALVQKNPGKYSYAHPSNGTIPHLLGELLKLRAGLDLVAVPFNGAGAAVMSTLGGHTPIVIAAVPGVSAAIKAGQLRALAVTSDRRISALPDVPTMKESGLDDMEGETLSGIAGPAGLPPEIVKKIHEDITWTLQQPETRERLSQLGFDAIGLGPQQFRARVVAEVEKWAKVIVAAKIPKIE